MTRAAGPPAAPARCHRTRFSLLKTGLYVCAYCRFCLAAPPSGFVISIKFLGSVGVSADSASAVYSRRTGLRTLGQSVYSLTYVRTASRFSHFGPPHRHCLQAFELGGLFRPERARAVAHHLFRAHAGSLYAGKRLLRIVHKHVLIRTTGVSWAGFSGDFVRRTLSTGPHILSRLFRTAASHGAGKPRMPRGPNVCFRAATVMAVRFFFVWPARTPRFSSVCAVCLVRAVRRHVPLLPRPHNPQRPSLPRCSTRIRVTTRRSPSSPSSSPSSRPRPHSR